MSFIRWVISKSRSRFMDSLRHTVDSRISLLIRRGWRVQGSKSAKITFASCLLTGSFSINLVFNIKFNEYSKSVCWCTCLSPPLLCCALLRSRKRRRKIEVSGVLGSMYLIHPSARSCQYSFLKRLRCQLPSDIRQDWQHREILRSIDMLFVYL